MEFLLHIQRVRRLLYGESRACSVSAQRVAMTDAERVAAFERVRARHFGFLSGVLWKLSGDRELFAEAMQYALLGLWRHVEKLEGKKGAGYIYRIALSANSRAWRERIGRNGDMPVRSVAANEDPEGKTQRAEIAALVRLTISRLPERQGRAVVMRYLEQMDYPAIAARLGCREAAARSHVCKAVARLRRELVRQGDLGTEL